MSCVWLKNKITSRNITLFPKKLQIMIPSVQIFMIKMLL